MPTFTFYASGLGRPTATVPDNNGLEDQWEEIFSDLHGGPDLRADNIDAWAAYVGTDNE